MMATKTLHEIGLLKVSNSNTFNRLTQSHCMSDSLPLLSTLHADTLPSRQKYELAQSVKFCASYLRRILNSMGTRIRECNFRPALSISTGKRFVLVVESLLT